MYFPACEASGMGICADVFGGDRVSQRQSPCSLAGSGCQIATKILWCTSDVSLQHIQSPWRNWLARLTVIFVAFIRRLEVRAFPGT